VLAGGLASSGPAGGLLGTSHWWCVVLFVLPNEYVSKSFLTPSLVVGQGLQLVQHAFG
jgi:hypothetical protein